MWAGAAEKQAWCPSTFQLLAERLWTAGGHNCTSWMVSLLGTSLHLLRWEGIVSSCSHLRCFLHVPVLAPVRRGVMRWPQARGGLGQALAETVTIRTRKQKRGWTLPKLCPGLSKLCWFKCHPSKHLQPLWAQTTGLCSLLLCALQQGGPGSGIIPRMGSMQSVPASAGLIRLRGSP